MLSWKKEVVDTPITGIYTRVGATSIPLTVNKNAYASQLYKKMS
jgi:hypothetical protein